MANATVYLDRNAAVRLVRRVEKLGGIAVKLRKRGPNMREHAGLYPVIVYSLPASLLRAFALAEHYRPKKELGLIIVDEYAD